MLYELEHKETLEKTIEREVEYSGAVRLEILEDGKWTEKPREYFESEKAKVEAA